MTEDELLRWAMEEYEKEMASRDTRDYQVNEIQFQKFVEAYRFFARLAQEGDNEIEPFRIAPTEVHGDITAYSYLFYLHDELLEQFSRIMSEASAVSIDAMNDGRVCISLRIPNVYKKKK